MTGLTRVGGGLIHAMTTKTSRNKVLDRSFLVSQALGRQWKASERSMMADRAFKNYANNVVPPRYRQALTEQFFELPLDRKVDWMQHARQITVAQDVIKYLDPKTKEYPVAKEKLTELTGQFTKNWVRDMAVTASLATAKLTGYLPDVKSELEQIAEGEEGGKLIPHLTRTSKADQKKFLQDLESIYNLMKQVENSSGIDPHKDAQVQSQLEHEIATFLEKIDFRAHEVGPLLVRIQEQFVDFDLASEVDWQESTEWTMVGGRGISTLVAILIAAILCAAWNEIKETMSKEEREANFAIQNEARGQVMENEDLLNSLKFDLNSITSINERLHLSKTNPELHLEVRDELLNINRRLSASRKKLIDLESRASQLTSQKSEEFKHETHAVMHELNTIKKTIVKRLSKLDDLSTQQTWKNIKRDTMVLMNYIDRSMLSPISERNYKKLVKKFTIISKAEPCAANVEKMKKIHEKFVNLAESEISLRPQELKTLSGKQKLNLLTSIIERGV